MLRRERLTMKRSVSYAKQLKPAMNGYLNSTNNHRNILLKDGDSYSTCIRECILGLAGLEIACEKISHAIVIVSNHLFYANFKLIDLPNYTTVRAIVDEGHYIVKRYIAKKLDEDWTRKKMKLLDTSFTLSSGVVDSLG
jgi:hypothetical protein